MERPVGRCRSRGVGPAGLFFCVRRGQPGPRPASGACRARVPAASRARLPAPRHHRPLAGAPVRTRPAGGTGRHSTDPADPPASGRLDRASGSRPDGAGPRARRYSTGLVADEPDAGPDLGLSPGIGPARGLLPGRPVLVPYPERAACSGLYCRSHCQHSPRGRPAGQWRCEPLRLELDGLRLCGRLLRQPQPSGVVATDHPAVRHHIRRSDPPTPRPADHHPVDRRPVRGPCCRSPRGDSLEGRNHPVCARDGVQPAGRLDCRRARQAGARPAGAGRGGRGSIDRRRRAGPATNSRAL